MDRNRYISITELCAGHSIDHTFIYSLNEIGLVEIITEEETPLIEKENLAELEKMLRLHFELDINVEGIDAIRHLLEKVSQLQEENQFLRNKLKFYED